MSAMPKILRPMVKISKNSLRFFNKNANLILTVVSATGVIATVVCAVKGTIKAVKLYEEKQPVGGKEVVKTVWKCYIPTIGMVVLTTTAILCNGRMNAKKIAMLTSAYGSSMEALKRMEDKMGTVLGPKKTQEVIDDVHSANAENNVSAFTEKDVIKTGHGDELFFLEDVGQWIYASTNWIELAELKTWKELKDSNEWDSNGDSYILLNNALANLGAHTCYIGGSNGWNSEDLSQLGLDGPRFRISSKRMEIPWLNGETRAVGTVWFEPEPMPI